MRRLRRLSRLAPHVRSAAADLLVLAGAAAALRGLALVWAPLPWLIGGLALAVAGVLLSPKTRKRRAQ